jgi:ferredoxin
MAKIPVIDLSGCIECYCCVEICPEVFKCNETVGYIEVAELEKYSQEDVQDAMNFCPTDCISWGEE